MQRLQITEQPVQNCRVLHTREKGNVLRTILLSDACHRELCEWWGTDRGTVEGNTYVFPGRAGPHTCATGQGHAGITRVTTHCKQILLRSGVAEQKAHTHIFRHTTVLMLHILGVSYEMVSKWIGHRSAVLTSSVYGKLPLQTLRALSVRVPFIGGTAATFDHILQRWEKAAHLIADPPWQQAEKNQTRQ